MLVTPRICVKGLKSGIDITEKSLSYPVAHIMFDMFFGTSPLNSGAEVKFGFLSNFFTSTPTGLPFVYQKLFFPTKNLSARGPNPADMLTIEKNNYFLCF